MKIRNKKTGEIVEIDETNPKQLAKYGLKLPKAQNGYLSEDPEFRVGDEGYYEPGGAGYGLESPDNIYNTSRFSTPMFQPLKKQNIGAPEIKGMPNYKQTLETPQINGYDYYNPETGEPNQQQRQSNWQQNNQNYPVPSVSGLSQNFQKIGSGAQKMAKGDWQGAIADWGGTEFELAKGFANIAVAQKVNPRLEKQVANNYKDALTQPFLNNYNDSQYGTTNIGIMEDGGIAKYKSMNQGGMANVEVENLETIQTPDGLIDTTYGNTHANGGIPMMLEEGSKVFSEKLKHPEKKKSFAKLAKKFETKKDFENLESPIADNINKFTADLNIQFKNKASDKLFAEQENLKLNGVFGEKVKNNTMKDYEMKYGGLIKMSGEDGKNIVDNEPPRSGTEGIGAEFFGGDLDKVYKHAKKLGYTGKKNIGDLQDFAIKIDPTGVSNYMELVSPNNKALEMYNQKRKSAGLKPITRDNLSEFSWSTFSPEEKRQAFKDEKWDFRFPQINSPVINKPASTFKTKELKPPDSLEIPKGGNYKIGKRNYNESNVIPIVTPFQEPYLESPVSRFKFNPNLIDYRKQNPDFTEIDRQYQGALTGDLRTDANLFKLGLTAKNQLNSQAFNQNQQGQMQVDQYNAGALDRNQQLQYGENAQYRNIVDQMRGNLNTQKLMDLKTAQGNFQKQQDYYNSIPVLEKLYGVNPNENYIKSGDPLSPYYQQPATKKYGGKVKKIKPKLRKTSK